jgi:zinc transport system permease protein
MVLSSVLAALLTSGGLALSYVADLPSGPTIIVLAGAVYLLAVGASTLRSMWARRRAALVTEAGP